MKPASTRVLGTIFTAAGLCLAANAAAQAPTFESILEGAKQEGRVVAVVSSPGKPESHAMLAEAFNKRFGLDLVVEWIPNSSVQTNTRLIAEKDRTEGSIDIVGSGGPVEVSTVLNEDIIKPWPWAEVFGEELPAIGGIVDSAMESIRGAALAIGDAAYGLAYNPNLIGEDELPGTYEELTNPEWKGRFAVNALGLYPIEYYSFVIGRDATLDFARRVLDNSPVLERGTAAATRAVEVGQAPVGISSFHQVARVDGLEFRLFDDYVPLTTLYIYVPESAPHPNAARLFSAWLVAEGMSLLDANEALPRILDERTDLNAMYKAQQEATGVKILTETSIEDIANGKEIRDTISSMMTQ
jgi:iron(III) transport system substrate-binding protein